MRRLIFAALILLVALAIGGPRVDRDTTIRFNQADIGEDPAAFLAAREARFSDIRPGLEKEIVWADPQRRHRTPIAFLYLHGFSASKGEIRPLPDLVASHFGANLFYTRLTGHGRTAEAMGEATVNAWVNDLAEALAIGRTIGEKVIVLATSTGGTLAAWGATDPRLMQDVAGLVLLSPNFEIQESGTGLLLLPWGEQLARLVLGDMVGETSENELRRKYWTSPYSVGALPPLAATVVLARERHYEDAKVPALFIFSDRDQVVVPEATRKVAERWAAPHRIIQIDQADDERMHVLAGDARSPSTTQAVAREIIGWVEQLP